MPGETNPKTVDEQQREESQAARDAADQRTENLRIALDNLKAVAQDEVFSEHMEAEILALLKRNKDGTKQT